MDERKDGGLPDDVEAIVPDVGDEPEDQVPYVEQKAKQDEFEQLLREHDGDFQAATDAQRRGEKPRGDPQGGASL